MSQVVYSYIGKEPVESKTLHCTIYPTPDYEIPEFICADQLRKDREKFVAYSNYFLTRRAKFRDEIIALLSEKGPMTTRIMAKFVNKTTSALYNVLHDHAGVFVALGSADDGCHSSIYGLPGQTLADVTQELDVEFDYKRIAKYLREHGPSSPGEIVAALQIKNSVVSSSLSDHPELFARQRKGNNQHIWRIKESI